MKDDKFVLFLARNDENSLFACNVMYLIDWMNGIELQNIKLLLIYDATRICTDGSF